MQDVEALPSRETLRERFDLLEEDDKATIDEIQVAYSSKEGWDAAVRKLKFYHGTSWAAAQAIQQDGFRISNEGCLGPGVYVGRKQKALRFACDRDRHDGTAGGLISCQVSFSFPKFISGDDVDGSWRLEGYDACRTDSTSRSENMEWCLESADQVQVLGIEWIGLNLDDAPPSESAITVSDKVMAARANARLAAVHENDGSRPFEWRCGKCGEAKNALWTRCTCGESLPDHAIGKAMGQAAYALSCAQDEHSLERCSAAQLAYTSGAMSGWVVALDDAVEGADHPPAFGNVGLMLPPPKKVASVDKTASFNLAIDRIQQQSMPPPPPRPPRYFARRHEERSMPARLGKRQRDDDKCDRYDVSRSAYDSRSASEDRGSQQSRHTSAYTLHSTVHSRERAEQRELLRLELQRCKKRGKGRLVDGGRWEYWHDGITLITDPSGKIAVTAYRRGTAPVEGAARASGKLPVEQLLDPDEGLPLDERADEPPPPTPRSEGGSTPKERASSSRSRSQSMDRAPGYGAGLGPIQEYTPDDRSDILQAVKQKARVVNEFALKSGMRGAGITWECNSCRATDNPPWHACISCGAPYDRDRIRKAKIAARSVLSQPHHMAAANDANPHRLGVMGGYAYGRYSAVKGIEGGMHPTAFAEVPALEPPPPKERCKLPDARLLGITISMGTTPWPDEEPCSSS